MTYSRVLALVLLCFTASHSYSNETAITGDIVNWTDFTGSYNYCGYSGFNGCWGGTSGGPAPSYGFNDETGGKFTFSYGTSTIAWQTALEQALREVGINIDGYNYAWTVKNLNANTNQPISPGGDPLEINVTFLDSNNQILEQRRFDFSGWYDWTTFYGTEMFDQSIAGADIEKITVTASGRDNGYWAGYYGPELETRGFDLQLIYSRDPCAEDPMSDPSCPGYVEALLSTIQDSQPEIQETQIQEDPIVTGTPEIATQTSSSNPTNSSNDIQSGGTVADGSMSGDTGSTGSQEERDQKDDRQEKLDIANSLSPSMPSLTTQMEMPGTIPGMEQVLAAEQIAMSGGMDNDQNGVANSQSQMANGLDPFQIESQGGIPGIQSDREARQERREAVNDTIQNQLAMSTQPQQVEQRKEEIKEESLEEESDQSEPNALAVEVQGFQAYQTGLPGGIYPDVAFYEPKEIPNSRKGLRNGLAQQLLHDQMVEMQYVDPTSDDNYFQR